MRPPRTFARVSLASQAGRQNKLLKREIKIFCSYSHRDERLREQIEDYTVSLRRDGFVTIWSDRCIQPGKERRREIDENLETADIVLLLISNDFLVSAYCYNIEMTRALERRRESQVQVLPVILRHCDWKSAKVGVGEHQIALGDLEAIPLRGAEKRLVPIESWQHRSEAFTAVAEALRGVVQKMATSQSPDRSNHEALQKPDVPDLLPHLCDRSRQEQILREAIRDWRKRGRVKWPFVIIIHGEAKECHEMYEERLTKETLPRLLRSQTESNSDVSYSTDEPLSLETHFVRLEGFYYPVKSPFEFLRSKLGEVVAHDHDASPKTITDALSLLKKPMMLSSHFSSREWEPDGSKIIESYLRFWNALPEISFGPPLICCLFFKYFQQSGDETNNAARRYLNSLKDRLASYRRIRAVVLDELPAVSYRDVDNWIREPRHFRSLCPAHPRSFCNIPKAIASIDLIFATEEAKSYGGNLPMDVIAPKLIQLIKENRC